MTNRAPPRGQCRHEAIESCGEQPVVPLTKPKLTGLQAKHVMVRSAQLQQPNAKIGIWE
jgi:hypothetical protein